jgi:hypothetical protein
MWRVSSQDTGTIPGEWRSEVEHIPTNSIWTFTTLDDLFVLLKQQAEYSQCLAQLEEDI